MATRKRKTPVKSKETVTADKRSTKKKAKPAGITPKKTTRRKKATRKKGKVAPPTKPKGSHVGKRRGKPGHPEFAPTNEQRGQVKAMAGLGFRQVDIAAVIVNPETGNGISTATLHQCFKAELVSARIRKIAKVADNLYRIACDRDGGGPSVTAAIFYLKARAGWSEKIEHTHTTDHGVLVVPGAMSPEQWVAEQQKLNGGRQPPDEITKPGAGPGGVVIR